MNASSTRLQHLPVTLFASVMGIGGLSLAWRRAAVVWPVPDWPAQLLFWVALAVFGAVSVLYAAKWVLHSAAARAELRHPIRLTFVPTITIALLVLVTARQDLLPAAARVAWWVGAIGHLALTIVVMSAWFGRLDIGVDQVTPAWFIPIVGNVITPLAARQFGDPVFRILFAATVTFVLMLLAQVRLLASIPFALPWWAYTFPLAATAAIGLAAAERLPGMTYDVVAASLLALATVVVTAVAVLTLRAAARRQICVPE